MEYSFWKKAGREHWPFPFLLLRSLRPEGKLLAVTPGRPPKSPDSRGQVYRASTTCRAKSAVDAKVVNEHSIPLPQQCLAL